MKRRLLKLFIVAVAIWIASAFVSTLLFIVLGTIGIFTIACGVSFLVANKLLKTTNWWKNRYLACQQFVSNMGYRDNIIRNYDVVNLGSNPAHFGFFYEDVVGQSWSTGSQGQDMDLEILKYFHSYLRKGGTVLIPIMPFTAISPFLKERPDEWGMPYYSKFFKILDYYQGSNLPYGKNLQRYLNYPLWYNKRALRYLIKDTQPDTRYGISEQPMMKIELQQDASRWIKGWLSEFRLNTLDDCFDERWEKYYDEAISQTKQIVDYCFERELKPVFICVPMTHYLSVLFPQEVWKYLVTDFVKACNEHDIPFLDYTIDSEFTDASLYFNSFFLNMRGRKLFTRRVLKDIGLL